ncbi:hypothetical protein MTsPCn9_29020 [Croceitalea sp. MTPC9]|uniref:hypothetical protein n=1 Tax=unclassified Croceitalea TaxID=2632280 RepID=UPI002B38CF31|nr:hypothetical protein MTsPCn6_30510 [Croceitalea sp. MTPC6]GMN17962.1 hypothetical protein MTsPCn9_29020 [Croceitalea sp. MTPC9]
MKALKKILLIILGLIVVLLLFAVWYNIKYAMDVVEPYEVNSANLEKSLLIATQGSVFKDRVTDAVINHYKSDAVFIKVIDIGNLDQINPDDFKALLLIHTWENWKPPMEVKSFIERTKSSAYKIVVLTTSGQGNYKMEEVDAITGESIIEDIPLFTEQIFERLNLLLRITEHKN